MDPNATLERLREAYGENDRDEIDSAAEDLLGWLRHDGYVPTLTEPQLSALLIMARGYARFTTIIAHVD